MCVQPTVMRVCFPYQSTFSRATVLDLHSASRVSCCSTGKQRLFLTVVCSIPARDVVIDFGKYKGCRLGTLPSGYLRWLVRESHQSSLGVWGDYAKQVLDDPYYKDRLEWQSIEKLAARGDMRKGAPLTASAGVKGSMMDLGWDLSNRDAWSKVNFSLLGTTAGGRIPRKKPDLVNPKHAVAKVRTAVPKLIMAEDTSSSLYHSKLQSPVSNSKQMSTNSIGSSSKLTSMALPTTDSQPSRSLTLQEELLRRRQLRKERGAASKSLSTRATTTENVNSLFPGRDSLLKRVRKKADT